MDIVCEEKEDATVVRITGRATIEGVEELRDQLMPLLKKGGRIEFDLSKVDTADTAFLQLLAAVCKSAERQGGTVALAPEGISDALREVLGVSGFAMRKVSASHPGCPLFEAFETSSGDENG